jgi:hypothetical protein
MIMLHFLTFIPAVAVLAAAPQAKEAEGAELVPVVLRIDVSALESAQEKRWVDNMYKVADRYIPPMLDEQGIRLVETANGNAATLTITMSWIDYQASIYATDITVSRPGFPDQKLERIVCEPCIDHMVVEQLEPHFPKILPWLAVDLRPTSAEEPAAVVEPSPAPTTEPQTSPRDDVTNGGDGSTDAPRRAVLGALGWTGVATAGAGAAALITGGVMFARGERKLTDTPRFEEILDFRPPGVATMIVGGVVLSAGVAILGVQLARRKKTRTSATMAITKGLGAVSIIHRF